MPDPYLAPALETLRSEINAAWPTRSKVSDGWIGDAAHKATQSDHNPDANGEVHAIDVTADGIDVQALVRAATRDHRCAYVIYDRTIWSRTHGMVPHAYLGSNPHTSYVHISCEYGPLADMTGPWHVRVPEGSSPAHPPATFPGGRVLRLVMPYMAGSDVQYVQVYVGEAKCGPADGLYGPHTERGVRWYQSMRGITVDGIVGPQTWANLLGRAG